MRRSSPLVTPPSSPPALFFARRRAGMDRGNRHHALRERPAQFSIPLHVAPEPRRDAVRDDFEAAAHRVAGVACAIDLRDHLLLDDRIGAVERRVAGGSAVAAGPIAMTWLTISAPTVRNSWRAMAPTATRAAVSRALARSSTF